MEKKIIEIPVLTPSEGMMLTNGETYSQEVWLGVNDSAENWREITEEEYIAAIREGEEAQ
ncbi:MAG: hypothetical protein IKU61_00905 [Clostridia bacterium]|nr:hypothetical protein [Clostridia bacterium]